MIVYHSALELRGCAYTVGHEVQVIARGEPGVFEAAGITCRFIKAVARLRAAGRRRNGRPLGAEGQRDDGRAVERTIADLFDRYDLAGGAEELFNSLDLVARVDAAALVRYARTLGNATAACALGSWLEREQKRLGVPDTALEEFRAMMPSQARYGLGTKSGEGKTAKGWDVILPIEVVERRFEGL